MALRKIEVVVQQRSDRSGGELVKSIVRNVVLWRHPTPQVGISDYPGRQSTTTLPKRRRHRDLQAIAQAIDHREAPRHNKSPAHPPTPVAKAPYGTELASPGSKIRDSSPRAQDRRAAPNTSVTVGRSRSRSDQISGTLSPPSESGTGLCRCPTRQPPVRPHRHSVSSTPRSPLGRCGILAVGPVRFRIRSKASHLTSPSGASRDSS